MQRKRFSFPAPAVKYVTNQLQPQYGTMRSMNANNYQMLIIVKVGKRSVSY
jgi:hypothetical protein